MNDDDRGLSPCTNHVAEMVPLDCTRGRDRRERFFSAGRGVGRAAGGGAGFACFCAAGLGGFAIAFFGAGAVFLATRRTAALVRDGRATAFFMMRLRVPREAFFP